MAYDAFLKIDGIKGESQDAKHKGEIEVLSWNWGATQAGSMARGTGGGAGRVNVQDITISKRLDAATPILLLHCMNGAHIKEALLTLRKAGKQAQEFLKIKLSGVLVTAVNDNAAGDQLPVETVRLSFGVVDMQYYPQKPDGTLDAAVPMKFDITKNIAP